MKYCRCVGLLFAVQVLGKKALASAVLSQPPAKAPLPSTGSHLPASSTEALPSSVTQQPRDGRTLPASSPSEVPRRRGPAHGESIFWDLSVSAEPVVSTGIRLVPSSPSLSVAPGGVSATESLHHLTDPVSTKEPSLNQSSSYISYWIITIIKVHPRENVSTEDFQAKMELRLAKSFLLAFDYGEEILNGTYIDLMRRKRAVQVKDIVVQIINISRAVESHDVTIVYYLEKNGIPVPAESACQHLKLFSEQELAILLGYVVVVKAEPYVKLVPPEKPLYWIVGAVLGSLAFGFFLIWCVLFIYFKCCQPPRIKTPRSARATPSNDSQMTKDEKANSLEPEVLVEKTESKTKKRVKKRNRKKKKYEATVKLDTGTDDDQALQQHSLPQSLDEEISDEAIDTTGTEEELVSTFGELQHAIGMKEMDTAEKEKLVKENDSLDQNANLAAKKHSPLLLSYDRKRWSKYRLSPWNPYSAGDEVAKISTQKQAWGFSGSSSTRQQCPGDFSANDSSNEMAVSSGVGSLLQKTNYNSCLFYKRSVGEHRSRQMEEVSTCHTNSRRIIPVHSQTKNIGSSIEHLKLSDVTPTAVTKRSLKTMDEIDIINSSLKSRPIPQPMIESVRKELLLNSSASRGSPI